MRYPMLSLSATLLLALLGLCPAQEPATSDPAHLDALIPHWKPGDRWTIETVSQPLHLRNNISPATTSSPLRWQFNVTQPDPTQDDCLRVEIACLADADPTPKAIFWLDPDSFTLRRVTTLLPVPGGVREMTVSYNSSSGQPAPILGPLSALPIDTPVLYAGAKGLQTFTYTSHFGTTQRKELGSLGFTHQIEQHIEAVPQDEVQQLLSAHFTKSLVDDPFTKSLASQPVTEVRLTSQGRHVRQLWQARRPWPIYCDNGYTVSRLVAVEHQEPQP